MPKFYCLYNSRLSDSLNVQERIKLLKESCNKHGIEFILIDESIADFSSLPIPNSDDALYNCARGSYLLESRLINRNVKSFYRNYPLYSQRDDSNFLCMELEKNKVPIPKTIFKGTNNTELLNQYVIQLKNFPIVIKTYGGTGGHGVIKIDNYQTLYSISDFLISKGIDFQLKEFICSSFCYRVCVLGNEVIYTAKRPIKKNDFRNNIVSDKSEFIEASNPIKDLAIKASHNANLNFSGVDIITCERTNTNYVLEVNCPQDFAIHQKYLDINISDLMIKYLFNLK